MFDLFSGGGGHRPAPANPPPPMNRKKRGEKRGGGGGGGGRWGGGGGGGGGSSPSPGESLEDQMNVLPGAVINYLQVLQQIAATVDSSCDNISYL